MGSFETYRSKISDQIKKELVNPSEINLPSSLERRKRAGISLDTYDYLELYNSIKSESSIKAQVDLAYSLILKRPADQEGSLIHQEILKTNGMIALIAQLRYSKEGRKKNTPIKGLFVPYMKYRFKHWLSKATI